MLNLGGDERAIADGARILVRNHKRAGDVATLRLSRVAAEPPVEVRLTTVEFVSLVAFGIERLDRPQLAHNGSTEGRSASHASPASKRSGWSSASRNRAASSSLSTIRERSARISSALARAARR